MENEVYEKDYGEEFRERSDKAKGKDFLHTLMDVGFFQRIKKKWTKSQSVWFQRKKRITDTCLENVTFSIKDGLLRMTIFIGYFDKVY